MKERSPAAMLRTLLDEFSTAGGVVEFVLLEGVPGQHLAAHAAAAVFGLEVLADRWYALGTTWRLTLLPERAQGQPISGDAFFGPPSGAGLARGFESAFKDPPYRLRHPRPDALFEGVVNELGLRDPRLEFVTWSTDWSNYFDPGLEWWGAHLWTILRPDASIVWIGASSTD